MQITISKNDSFIRHASLHPIDAIDGQFFLQFSSVLLTSKNPDAANRNFEAVLDLDGLLALKRLIDEVLRG